MGYIPDPNDSRKQIPDSRGRGYEQLAGYSI